MLHYDTTFPIKKFRINKKNLRSPWITKGILKSSKRKQKLYEHFLKSKTLQNENVYKSYKRLFGSIKQKSKTNYYKEQLTRYRNNVKKT